MEKTFDGLFEFISKGRNKRDRPLANNTRAILRDSDTIAIRLHATDIATFRRDGRVTLDSGGWRTVTTSGRIRDYTNAHLYAEQGVWYVRTAPDEKDPRPARRWREIPKPFHALDPGPEPVKDAEGCVAGTRDMREHDEEQLVSKYEIEHGEVDESEVERPYERDSDYYVGYRTAHVVETTTYGEESWGESPRVEGRDAIGQYEQCPHCKLFTRQHDAWRLAMNGGWGRERGKGYRQMCEMLERFGSREAWQDAYLAEFREVRENNRARREWEDRNRVLFFDGIEIDGDGYAPRPKNPERDRAALRAINAKKREVNEFVKFCCDELEAGNVPMPSGGDCWLCCMRDSDTGEPWGDWRGDNHEHLQSHIDEKYVVPSMLVNAMRERGYQDVGIYMMLGMDPDNNVMGRNYRREQGAHGGDSVQRALRRYLQARLVPQATGSAPSGAALRETGLQTGGR